ncbi:unnamed protein product [Trifolium pratense]|uniref:Uncharacterized protein n=1 Tax=Trifolium pratense TaxID=57577 RepID=A0ACB0KUP8_TRIPR|nr:unnamed protein product [Trifolium pratense]
MRERHMWKINTIGDALMCGPHANLEWLIDRMVEAHDPLDPTANITIKWDVMSWAAYGYQHARWTTVYSAAVKPFLTTRVFIHSTHTTCHGSPLSLQYSYPASFHFLHLRAMDHTTFLILLQEKDEDKREMNTSQILKSNVAGSKWEECSVTKYELKFKTSYRSKVFFQGYVIEQCIFLHITKEYYV